MSTMDIREAWKKQKELERMKTISQLLGFFTNGVANFSILSKTDVDMYSSSV